MNSHPSLFPILKRKVIAVIVFVASTLLSAEALPAQHKHSPAPTKTVWPASDGECTVPSGAGEDYSGVQCNKTEIETTERQFVAVQAGEDYSGPQVAPADVNEAKNSRKRHSGASSGIR